MSPANGGGPSPTQPHPAQKPSGGDGGGAPNAPGRLVLVNPSGDLQIGQTEGFEEAEREARLEKEQRERNAHQQRNQSRGQHPPQRPMHGQHGYPQGRYPPPSYHPHPNTAPRAPPAVGVYAVSSQHGPGVIYATHQVYMPPYAGAPGGVHAVAMQGTAVSERDLHEYTQAAEEIKRRHVKMFTFFILLGMAGVILGLFTTGVPSFAGWVLGIIATISALFVSVSMRQKIRQLQINMLGVAYQ